jgi:hypothetical protein
VKYAASFRDPSAKCGNVLTYVGCEQPRRDLTCERVGPFLFNFRETTPLEFFELASPLLLGSTPVFVLSTVVLLGASLQFREELGQLAVEWTARPFRPTAAAPVPRR